MGINKKDEVISFVKSYFYDYLTLRDYNKIISYFSEDITWFGTGIGEICNNGTEAQQLMRDDIKQMPDSLTLFNDRFNAYEINDNTFIVWGIFSAAASTSAEGDFLFEGVRATAVCTYNDVRWSVRHFHVSLPHRDQDKDEFYPLKEIEGQNLKLQQLVQQKTAEIEKQKEQLEIANHRIREVNSELITANIKLSTLNEILREQASTDILTDTLNHHYIMKRLSWELDRSKEINQPLCILMIDLDHYKEINDKYGHVIGDKVLAEFPAIIKKKLRKSDSIGRYGGEEFLVILPDSELDEAVIIAQRIKEAIYNHKFTEYDIGISASIGVSYCKPDYTAEKFINDADKMLYKAKESGRNTVAF